MKTLVALLLYVLISDVFCVVLRPKGWSFNEVNNNEESGENYDLIAYEDEHQPTMIPTTTMKDTNNVYEFISDSFLQIHKIDLDDRRKYIALGLVVDKVHANYTANEIATQLSTYFNQYSLEKWISIVIPKDLSIGEFDLILTQLEKNIIGNFWFTYGEYKVILMKTDLKQRCPRL